MPRRSERLAKRNAASLESTNEVKRARPSEENVAEAPVPMDIALVAPQIMAPAREEVEVEAVSSFGIKEPMAAQAPLTPQQKAQQAAALESLALRKQSEGDYAGAIKEIETILKLYPNFPHPQRLLAFVHLKAKNYNEAKQMAERVIHIIESIPTQERKQPDVFNRADAYLIRAKACHQLALKANNLIELENSFAFLSHANRALSEFFISRGDEQKSGMFYQQAVVFAMKFSSAKSEFIRLQLIKARRDLKAKKISCAQTHIDEILKIESNPYAYEILTRINEAQKKYAEMVTSSTQIIANRETTPVHPRILSFAYSKRAMAQTALGIPKKEQALDSLQAATLAAQFYARSGNIEKASHHFGHALAAGKDILASRIFQNNYQGDVVSFSQHTEGEVTVVTMSIQTEAGENFSLPFYCPNLSPEQLVNANTKPADRLTELNHILASHQEDFDEDKINQLQKNDSSLMQLIGFIHRYIDKINKRTIKKENIEKRIQESVEPLTGMTQQLAAHKSLIEGYKKNLRQVLEANIYLPGIGHFSTMAAFICLGTRERGLEFIHMINGFDNMEKLYVLLPFCMRSFYGFALAGYMSTSGKNIETFVQWLITGPLNHPLLVLPLLTYLDDHMASMFTHLANDLASINTLNQLTRWLLEGGAREHLGEELTFFILTSLVEGYGAIPFILSAQHPRVAATGFLQVDNFLLWRGIVGVKQYDSVRYETTGEIIERFVKYFSQHRDLLVRFPGMMFNWLIYKSPRGDFAACIGDLGTPESIDILLDLVNDPRIMILFRKNPLLAESFIGLVRLTGLIKLPTAITSRPHAHSKARGKAFCDWFLNVNNPDYVIQTTMQQVATAANISAAEIPSLPGVPILPETPRLNALSNDQELGTPQQAPSPALRPSHMP